MRWLSVGCDGLVEVRGVLLSEVGIVDDSVPLESEVELETLRGAVSRAIYAHHVISDHYRHKNDGSNFTEFTISWSGVTEVAEVDGLGAPPMGCWLDGVTGNLLADNI